MRIPNMDVIKDIIRNLECEPDVLIRVTCPYCSNGKVLILDPQRGRFECQACIKHGKLEQLVALASHRFEGRHKQTISMMTERTAVEKIPGGR